MKRKIRPHWSLRRPWGRVVPVYLRCRRKLERGFWHWRQQERWAVPIAFGPTGPVPRSNPVAVCLLTLHRARGADVLRRLALMMIEALSGDGTVRICSLTDACL